MDTKYSSSGEIYHHEDEINLKEIWRIILIYKRAIFLILFTTLLVIAFFTITTEPIYESTTTVMVKESNTDPSAFVFDFGANNSKQRLKNEIEVLNSYNLHDKVVQSLIEDNSANRLALFGTRYVDRRYRLISYLFEFTGGNELPRVNPNEFSFSDRIKIVQKLRRATRTNVIRDADVIKISVTSTDSSDAIFLANRISETYRSQDLAGGQGELHFVLTFLDSQIAKYEDRLRLIENELKAFQELEQIYSLDGAAELLLQDLTNYEGVYYTNVAELEVAQERVQFLKSQLSESEKALMDEITNTNNPMIVALRGKIAELEAQKVQQMVDEGWDSSSLQAKDFDRRIAEMKSRLTGLTESLILSGWSEEDPFAASQEIFNKIVEQEIEVHAARSRAKEYKNLVDKMAQRLSTLPSQTLQYARLERDLRLNENLYLTMKQKYEESRITQAGKFGKVSILDPALIAARIRPNTNLNIMIGLLLGVVLGGAYAFFREFWDSTVKTVETLERKGLTVLGIIPDMQQDKIKKIAWKQNTPSKGGTDFRRRLITYEDPKSPISESYRSLRTNVHYSTADKDLKSLLISSPQPGEGKSTTTANLAIAFAQLRRKTLLIDADLRKPVQHNVFGLERGPGLSEYLIGEVEGFGEIIQPTKIENLFLLTAGGLPPNPSELLGSNRMSKLVDQLESEWDMVLLDSPPIVAVTDASSISGEIDALGLVVKAGQTERAAVDRALDTISNVKAPLVGVIMNGVTPETLAGKYSYYYSYYNYYYHSDEEKK